MAGAHMLIMYGDTLAPYGGMTVSVRTADGHHPPRPIEEFPRFEKYFVPEVEVVTAKFEQYTGPFFHKDLNLKPSHVGITEAIIRGWGLWPGVAVDNSSSHQAMLWSSNYKQDFLSDFSVERNIDMHMFGLGFGFLWVDMLNAETPYPMFGPVDELGGLKGVSEVARPAEPTKEELEAGEAYIQSVLASSPTSSTETATIAPTSTPTVDSTAEDNFANTEPQDGAIPDPIHPGNPTAPPPPPADSVQQPARTLLGKSIRDWMWHLHGLLMTLSFLALYPLGVYLLRRPPVSATDGSGFNSHWTIQTLGSISLLVGSAIGYVNSHSISVRHQYIGLFLVLLIGVQIFLGWRHHVLYLATKRKTLFGKVHIYTGRVILPLGYVNIVLGMLLRRYGWLTMTLVVVFMLLQAAFLAFVLASKRNARIDTGKGTARGDAGLPDHEAEEYFQLDGDEDEDEFDSDGEETGASAKQDERRKQAERLARLDKV